MVCWCARICIGSLLTCHVGLQHEGAYLLILAAVKGSQGEKRLAGSFLARFFSHFPKLHENAIDAMLDLCEDEDSLVSVSTRLWQVLIISLPRVINSKFPLQPHQKDNIIQYEDLGFSWLTRIKDDYTTNSHYITDTSLLKGWKDVPFELSESEMVGMMLS